MLAAGYRDGMTAAGSGMSRPGGGTEVWRFGAAAANHNGSQRTIPVPVEMEKEPYEVEVNAIGKIKIIFL